MVIQELHHHNQYEELDLKFSYWQTSTGHEVDLILSRGASQPIAAIEIKSSSKPDQEGWKGLKAFAEDFPHVPRYCLSNTPTPYSSRDGVLVIPWQEGVSLLRSL